MRGSTPKVFPRRCTEAAGQLVRGLWQLRSGDRHTVGSGHQTDLSASPGCAGTRPVGLQSRLESAPRQSRRSPRSPRIQDFETAPESIPYGYSERERFGHSLGFQRNRATPIFRCPERQSVQAQCPTCESPPAQPYQRRGLGSEFGRFGVGFQRRSFLSQDQRGAD